MCNTDTGVLGQVWFDQESPTAFPDFNTKHKCKNFDDISKWAVEHQVRKRHDYEIQDLHAIASEPIVNAIVHIQEAAPDTLPDDYMKEPRPEYVGENTP